jgi:hypothetical protein
MHEGSPAADLVLPQGPGQEGLEHPDREQLELGCQGWKSQLAPPAVPSACHKSGEGSVQRESIHR